nr:MAG TPA: hypothetical protein [Caudoviricetes sp.]
MSGGDKHRWFFVNFFGAMLLRVSAVPARQACQTLTHKKAPPGGARKGEEV